MMSAFLLSVMRNYNLLTNLSFDVENYNSRQQSVIEKNPRIIAAYYLGNLIPILEFFDNYQPLL